MYINVSLLYLRWTCSLHCVNSRNSQFGNKIIVDIFTMSLLPLFLIVTSYLSILLLISGLLTNELLTNYYNITKSHTKMIAHFSSRNDLCSIWKKYTFGFLSIWGRCWRANSECYIYWYAPRRLFGHSITSFILMTKENVFLHSSAILPEPCPLPEKNCVNTLPPLPLQAARTAPHRVAPHFISRLRVF